MKDIIKSIVTAIKSLLPPRVPSHTEDDKEELRRCAAGIVMARR